MDFLQSFSLRDLLIFSSESYFKIFEISNKAIWPFHIPLALLAFVALVLLYKRQRFASRSLFIWLGLVWAFVAYSYFGKFFSQISTYANYVSYAFWAEACLLFIYAFLDNNEASKFLKTTYKKWQLISGGGLILYGLVIHPIVSLLIWNQSISRVEFFSIAPDPTAIATLGIIILLPVKGYLLLTVVPCLWILFSIMTYQAF